MGRRGEEKVDAEELARLMGSESGDTTRIRVRVPNEISDHTGVPKEMYALAEQMLGGRRLDVLCADGIIRRGRIPGKMRRRQWVREGDLVIFKPHDFLKPPRKEGDVVHRYTKTQSLYLSRLGVLPEPVDIFGLNTDTEDFDDEDGLFSRADDAHEPHDPTEAMDDEDSDDLFDDDEGDEEIDSFFS